MADGNKHLITLINKKINMTQSEINKLSMNDLRRLNKMVVEAMKVSKKNDAKAKRKTLSVGQKVVVEHKKTSGKVFIISDIKVTKATIKEQGGFASYSVPLSMIEPYCY